jgi:hypothetical protein
MRIACTSRDPETPIGTGFLAVTCLQQLHLSRTCVSVGAAFQFEENPARVGNSF